MSVLASGLSAPWDLAFLPDGSSLVTERDSNRILLLPPGGGTPREVARIDEASGGGEGGLLGIAVSPAYTTDSAVYVYYTTREDNRIARLQLGVADRPTEVRPIVTGIPASAIHDGGRLLFGPDGMLWASTGDASATGNAQNPSSLGGKVLRLMPDGRAPADNPYPGSLVWSLGHRNVQGLAFDPQGRLFATEFGARTWDEVNRIERGRNYGWPEVEGPGDGGGRFVAPLVVWQTQDASPSGATIVGGSLYATALRGERLWRVPLNGSGGTAGEPEALLRGQYGRLRHVTVAPDGSLWLLTSNRDGRGRPTADDDRILRLTV